MTSPTPAAALPGPKRRSVVHRLLDVVAIVVLIAAGYKLFLGARHYAGLAPHPAPAVNLESMSGGRFSLAAHRGHVVFLDFWASWCTPCQASLPLVESWARAHRDAADVVAVDAGEDPAVAAKFARGLHLENVAFDPSLGTVHDFHVDGFPTMVVIDPKGVIEERWEGYNPAVASAMSDAAAKFTNR